MAGQGGIIRPKVVGKDLFKDLERRVDQMVIKLDSELVAAAHTATSASRQIFDKKRSNRPFIDPRPGRATTRGAFSQSIEWRPTLDGPTGNGIVALDIQALEAAYPGGTGAPIWLINEIGTGASAFIDRARSGTGASGSGARRITVKSQEGRPIKFGLVWGTGTGGKYTPPGGGADQQLYPSSTLTGVPQGRRAQIRISKEIEPKHYLRDGGEQGFRQFEQSALAAAYAAFAGHKRR